MCGVVYEVLAALVEAGVWHTGAGIPSLKSKKGELMKGAKMEFENLDHKD